MQFFFDQHIDHFKHQVWYLCDQEGRNGVNSGLCANFFQGLTVVEDIESKDQVLTAAAVIYKQFKFDRVVALDELTLLSAASIRDVYQISGPRENEILYYRDKELMKQALAHTNVKTIPPICLDSISPDNFVPCVVKPTSEAGSQGVVICQDYDTYLTAREQNQSAMIEQYTPGEIYYIDGAFNEQGVICLPNRYVGTCYEHFNCQQPLIGVSIDQPDLIERIQQLTEEVIESLPLKQGIFHLELIHTPDDNLLFLEIACRIGGCSYNVPKDVFGADLIKYHILSDLGQAWDLPKIPQDIYSGMLMLNSFPSHPRRYLGFNLEPLSGENCIYKTVFPVFGKEMNQYDGTLFGFKSDSSSQVESSIREIISKFRFV